MSKWLEAKKIKGKFYIDSSDFSNIVKEYSDKIDELEEENKKLKESLDIATKCSSKEEDGIIRLSEENRKLKDENVDLKSELSKFRDSFKKYRDYEKEELAESCYDLARENEKLKEENEWFNKKIKEAGKYVGATMKENRKLEKENKKLRKNYYNLSKIVETTGGYKASYVNELRDKIAKLEFDIETWKKLKAVREEKERMLNEKIGKLVMKQ